jgi:hypothetical protein
LLLVYEIAVDVVEVSQQCKYLLPANGRRFTFKLKGRKHMRWISSQIFKDFGTAVASSIWPRKKASPVSVHEIRQAMLESLGELAEKHFPLVQLRITYAIDIEDLWYLRGDVMSAIASKNGEAFAKEKISQISEMFVGLVPSGFTHKLAAKMH